MAVERRERPLAEAGADIAAMGDRVERLDELEALAVLAERHLTVQRAVALVRRPGREQDRDAILDVRGDLPDADGADQEEAETRRDVREARRRDVQHGEEDPEVEKA